MVNGFNPHSIVRLNVSCCAHKQVIAFVDFNPHPVVNLDESRFSIPIFALIICFNPHPIIILNVRGLKQQKSIVSLVVSILIQLLD